MRRQGNRSCFALLATVGLMMMVAARSEAALLLQFDLNEIAVQVKSGTNGTGTNVPLSVAHTGSLSFSAVPAPAPAPSFMSSVRVDAVNQNGAPGTDLFAGTLQSMSGHLNLTAGVVSGGQLTFTVANGAATDTYTTSLLGVGQVVTPIAGGNFTLGAAALGGDLSDDDFAGVNVSTWENAEPFVGELILPLFHPDATGFARTSVELSAVVVPEPAALGAVAMAAGLLVRRRRPA
jgi:hypothetical protein